jgi:hypothetical protein
MSGFLINPYRFAAAGDPYFSSVSLLLQPISGGSIVDLSPSPKTVTALGNAQVSTAQSAFSGGAAIAFDGTGDYLTVPASSGFAVDSSSFTVELFFYVNANPGLAFGVYRRHLLGNYNAGSSPPSGWALQLRGTQTDYTSIALADGDNEVLVASATIAKNAWHCLAFVKSGADNKLFFNGTQIGATASRTTYIASSANVLQGGRILDAASAWDFPGYMGPIRITKGVARDVSTVPTAPYPTS